MKMSIGAALSVLAAWDKIETFRDAWAITRTVLLGGTPSPLTLVLFGASIFPFGRVLKYAKHVPGSSAVFNAFSGAKGVLTQAGGNLTDAYRNMLKKGGRAVDDVAEQISEEVAEELADEAADIVVDIGLKNASKAAETVGELGAIAVAKKMGLEPVKGFVPKYHGIDQLFINPQTGKYVIVEAKGGTAKLAMTKSGTSAKDVQQLSQDWIKNKIESLKKADIASREIAEKMENQLNDIEVMLVSTKIDVADDIINAKVHDPEYIIRKFSEIGQKTFLE
jgi:hypothetical protein